MSRLGRRSQWLSAALICASLASPLSVEASPPDFVLQIPETGQSPGQGAGELDNPRSLAADPDTGHIFVADRRNARVSEYTAWGLFVKSWGWGVADGSAVPQTCGPSEPQEDPDPSLCRKGIAGEGKGQMALLTGGMAVDDEGNVWVGDLENHRVQKFGPGGGFLLMLGGNVNETKVDASAPAAQRNLCPVDLGDVCQAGIPGEEPSQLSPTIGDYIDYSPTADAILVGDKDGIQVFDLDGAYREEIAFEGPLAAFAGQSINALDVDEAGNVYFSLTGLEDVYKMSSAGEPLAPGKPGESKFEVGNPLGVAVDVGGDVYAIDDPPGSLPELEAKVMKFSLAGTRLLPTNAEEEAALEPGASAKMFPYIPFHGPSLMALATNFCASSSVVPGNLYLAFFLEDSISRIDAYGTAPIGCEAPPARAPEIAAQFASSVGREEATVEAQINPFFWPDATYYVEYGTGRCAAGGCPFKAPLTPAPLTEKSVNEALSTHGVVLDGLAPGTVYHYRFVAESGGGGPVYGVDPDGRGGTSAATPQEGLDSTFKTFAAPSSASPCGNDAVRIGVAVRLPDCRAYEMVSPLDKGGGDVAAWGGRNALVPQLFELHQSALSGDGFAYTSWLAFGDPEGAPFVSSHLATRGPSSWTTESISPPYTESPVNALSLLENGFQGFSQDLCKAWLRHYSVAPLAAGAVAGYPNIYRRENCGTAAPYEALTPVEPPTISSDKYFELRVHGFSDDGHTAVFTANDELAAGAPSPAEDELLLYEHMPEGLRFVCFLPGGKGSSKACAAGTPGGKTGANQSSTRNAVSDDGSRIFWTSYTGPLNFGVQPGTPGQIFVRIDGKETRKVSTVVTPEPAFFWTASNDGSRAIFEVTAGTLDGNLYSLEVDTQTPTLIAKDVEGPMGASEDASRVYFASTEDLDGGGPAAAGDHNLYLFEAAPGGVGGTFTFIMELAEEDIGGTDTQPTPIDEIPSQRSARVTPDGLHAAFTSVVSPTPTGHDNRDANSHEPTPLIYLYDAAENELRCVSCNPSGSRPVGEDVGGVFSVWISARIQGWEALNHAPRVLSEDGKRVFFESFEALVPRDTNSTWDVYQWEEAGKGTCTPSSETYAETSGGCVDLISAGTSAAKSTFLDADPSGDNVFFSTQSSLVGADYGLNDVYVARVGGGFPEPQPKAPCKGEACQSPSPPPPELTPATEAASGPGNARRRRCPKGKRRVKRAGKVRCVKRKRKAKAKAKAGRRAAR